MIVETKEDAAVREAREQMIRVLTEDAFLDEEEAESDADAWIAAIEARTRARLAAVDAAPPERDVVASAEDIKALVEWANEAHRTRGTTGFGPRFDAAFAAASRLREQVIAATWGKPQDESATSDTMRHGTPTGAPTPAVSVTDILDELRRLDAEATPGKWRVTALRRLGICVLVDRQNDDGTAVAERLDEVDAALIAAARNALPALVEVARAARQADQMLAVVVDVEDVITRQCEIAHNILRAALARLDGGA